MNRKKILLAYITDYSGHHRAALAIKRALIKLGVNKDDIKDIDFLKYLHPIGRIIVEKSYLRMLKKNPQTWEYLYDNRKVRRQLEKWINWLGVLKFSKLTRLIEKFDPDIICCTQAFPALMLANFKPKMALPPIVGVLTDYSPHRYWVHPGIDLYVVPSDEVAGVLVNRGVKPERIRDFGIPIDPEFIIERVDKKAIMKEMGLMESWPVVLLMGGGQGLGPIREVIKKLADGFRTLFNLVVVCGRNAKLRKEIQREADFFHWPIKVLGYTENINKLMKISSLIVTKPGGQTISEALACGLPMVLINPIPGQEVRNAQVLIKHNLAVLADDSEDAAHLVFQLLNDRETREQMRSRAEKFAKPDAALAIAYALIKGWG